VRFVLNVIWLALAGFWLAVSYMFAAILLAVTIIGLPFEKQSLKLAAWRQPGARRIGRRQLGGC
jgi:uncharacterized membrane protein YccF (DUF307 family)